MANDTLKIQTEITMRKAHGRELPEPVKIPVECTVFLTLAGVQSVYKEINPTGENGFDADNKVSFLGTFNRALVNEAKVVARNGFLAKYEDPAVAVRKALKALTDNGFEGKMALELVLNQRKAAGLDIPENPESLIP